MDQSYIKSCRKQFEYYKSLGDKTMSRLTEDELYFTPEPESNSIAVIVNHLYGNMLSRWTDFLTTDGEKEWRDRDGEFEITRESKQNLLVKWEKGWICLFNALDQASAVPLYTTIYIRKEPHTVLEAINRQLAHYPYHVGQIVFIGKMITGKKWESLSIPKKGSAKFNEGMNQKFGKSNGPVK